MFVEGRYTFAFHNTNALPRSKTTAEIDLAGGNYTAQSV